jgi:hypothetical protein
MQKIFVTLRDVFIKSAAARAVVVIAVAAVLVWLFAVPAWLKLALVKYIAIPLLAAIAAGAVVAWLSLSGRLGLRAFAWAAVVMIVGFAWLLEAQEGKCTGYVAYPWYQTWEVVNRGLEVAADAQSKGDGQGAHDISELYAIEAQRAYNRMCFTLSDWRASWGGR